MNRLSGHRPLIVEDNPAALAAQVEIVQSLGHEPRTATHVAEALVAIAEEDFCYLLVDQELPWRLGAQALVSGGARIMEAYRKRDDRRAGAEGRHVTQIIVVSGYSREYRFVVKMFEQGADDFVAKPVGEHAEELIEVINRALKRSGRREHAGCAGMGVARAAVGVGVGVGVGGGVVVGVELCLDGGIVAGRTTFHVNGVRRSLQDAKFVVLLRLVAVHERAAGTWTSRVAMGIVQRDMTTRVREAFEGVLPEGFELVESDRRGNFRLNPAVVGRVEWGALEGHPDPGVGKVVAEWRRRKG